MLRRYLKPDEKAQIFLEYTMVIGAVILIMFAMSTMLKRGTQAMILVVADHLGNQVNADQSFSPTGGFLVNSYTSTRGTFDRTIVETVDVIGYHFGDITYTRTNTLINLGFTNEI